ELEKILLLVVEADLSSLGGAHERAQADLDLDVAVRSRVEHVTGRERGVDLRRSPVVGTGPPEGDLAVDVADARRGDVDYLRRGRRVTRRRRRGVGRSGLSVKSSPHRGRRAGQQAQREKPCNDLP